MEIAEVLMDNKEDWKVSFLRNDAEDSMRAKDEEYLYWQSRTPLERLVAMQELSLAFFEECSDEVEIRQQFLRTPVCLRRP